LKSERNNYKNALIVTETVFSMDGDIAPLKELISLKEEYGCVLMVDEAHATGVFGDNGAGLTDGGGIPEKVDIIMGTFSKALGAFGAYAAVSGDMRDFLVNTCRSFIYSTSLPPSLIAASIEALKLVKEEPWRRKRLLENAGYFRERLAARGLDIRGSSQIVPIVVGKNDDALKMSAFLRSRGYWAAPVRPPSVPKGEARLRISVTFDHTREMLDRFISECVSE
jgi:7-keto-8-aminopelargonate synthetase-like enzyme